MEGWDSDAKGSHAFFGVEVLAVLLVSLFTHVDLILGYILSNLEHSLLFRPLIADPLAQTNKPYQ